MKIIKVYNNNVVHCADALGDEVIITGAGVGFKKSIGDSVEEARITQRFYLKDDVKQRLYKLLDHVPGKYFSISDSILRKAKERFGKPVTISYFAAFTDHLAAAIERSEHQMYLPNIVLMETKTLWPKEFEFSLWVLEFVEEQTGIQMPVDEAGYMTQYFVSETEQGRMSKTSDLIQYVHDISRIIETDFGIEFDKESLAYMRLVTHLRYFVGRILAHDNHEDQSLDDAYAFLMAQNDRFKVCQEHLKQYFMQSFHYDMSTAEMTYLMIHIKQILNKI